ncbi:hypothetical protein JCM31826_08960 [Thermaurantimonas aggregans]|uniref:DUF202 domain-containing protein n=1 Tax=Thermaurantimonas aggregans TaxID=2173829 RepID=A0A401XKA3_9FLAO|nr:DUF202 domain-containing protein [Thermaurantimonas aggregans]MCX8148509.1 DUF202 domain-containing protein [Thermaurantimonas aggregans]GCD77414.1 hypothetical protein JCM31826_08960 [Thermaurantimonas aggregans]
MNENQFERFNKDLVLREKLALQRTIMANQTTFLAFLRTSLYFVVAGLTIHQVLEVKGGHFFEGLFLSIASVLFLIGIINFFVQKRLIEKSKIHIGNYKMEYLGERVENGILQKEKRTKKFPIKLIKK